MVTFTGTQHELTEAIIDLILLEYDAIEAYKSAVERLENKIFSSKLQEFQKDHEQHIKKLSEFLTQKNIVPPKGPDVKQWLAKGKTILAGLISDRSVLQAMNSNEDDTNTAYERMTNRDDLDEKIKSILSNAYDDEKKHKKWIEDTLEETK
jgi:rubrerythrin